MLTILFFDTETNGLPKDRKATTQDTEKWPYILQISWTLLLIENNCKRNILESQTHYLRLPDNVQFDTEASKIHKIQESIVRAAPDSKTILDLFKKVSQSANVIVAHNLAFDKPALYASFYRINKDENFNWWPSYEFCTMEQTKGILKLPSKFAKPNDPWKYPRLSELHKYLFEVEPVEILHSAETDVAVLIKCFLELVERRVVPLDKWEEALRVREKYRDSKKDE